MADGLVSVYELQDLVQSWIFFFLYNKKVLACFWDQNGSNITEKIKIIQCTVMWSMRLKQLKQTANVIGTNIFLTCITSVCCQLEKSCIFCKKALNINFFNDSIFLVHNNVHLVWSCVSQTLWIAGFHVISLKLYNLN